LLLEFAYTNSLQVSFFKEANRVTSSLRMVERVDSRSGGSGSSPSSEAFCSYLIPSSMALFVRFQSVSIRTNTRKTAWRRLRSSRLDRFDSRAAGWHYTDKQLLHVPSIVPSPVSLLTSSLCLMGAYS
jgi:hypothetical protein